MKKLYSLVMMQLKDKIDFSFASDRKKLITKIVLSIVKFIAITAICYLLIYVCRRFLGLFWADEIPSVMVFVLTIFFVMSVVSCTAGLVKTMYFAEDNKVLVTFPLGGNVVFLSKLLVFYVYEVIKSFNLLVPLVLGFLLSLVTINMLSPIVFLVVWVPLVIYTAISVLVGALLSIPTQYLVRFFKRFKFAGYALFVLVLAAIVYGIVSIIAIMPENINLYTIFPNVIKPAIQSFLQGFITRFSAFSQVVYIFIGEGTFYGGYAYTWLTLLKLLAMVSVVAVLFGLVFITTRYLFYSIMRKSFEYDKKAYANSKANRMHGVRATFLIKEIRLSLRSTDIVLNFLSVYVAVPIMIFLMNKVFLAINTSIRGDNLSYAFNVLIITLPMLASNSMIASAFSREGRAGYIKKTKPINVLLPLSAKLFINVFASLVSLIVSVSVFTYLNNFNFLSGLMLFIGIASLHLGHMVWSATRDLTNPQNEQYSTVGGEVSNPNENLSTLIAFIASAAFALLTYLFFSEIGVYTTNAYYASLKLCLIGVVILVAATYMFVAKVKAYYYER